MFKNFILSVSLMLTPIGASACASGELIYEAMQKQGFYEFVNQTITEQQYANFYKSLDAFWKRYTTDEEFSDKVRKLCIEYRNHGNPPPYDDPINIWQAMNQNSEYMQALSYTPELIHYIEQNHPNLLFAEPILAELCTNFKLLYRLSNVILSRQIDALDTKHHGLKDVMYQGKQNLALVIKLIRSTYSMMPHVDRTVMSLLLHNDDPPGQECLKLALMPKNLHRKDYFNIPRKLYQNSSVMIPGYLLKEIAGLPIEGTAHLVEKPARVRHSIVVFARTHGGLYPPRPVRLHPEGFPNH